MDSYISKSWIQKIKSSKLKKPNKKCSSVRIVSNNYELKNQLSNNSTSNSSSTNTTNQLNDYSSSDFFLYNENNNEILNIDNQIKENSLTEFDLNNNDLNYSSLCFDNIDLTSNDNKSAVELNSNDQNSNSLGVKFLNLNHNPELSQRSNSVPMRNCDSLFNNKLSTIENTSNDLNNIDLNYSSLYFEAIDLCLPTTSNNLNQQSVFVDNSPGYINNNHQSNNGSAYSFKFINSNHNPDIYQRSISVPLNNTNLKTNVYDLASCIVNESSKINNINHIQLSEEINFNEKITNDTESIVKKADNKILENVLNEKNESIAMPSTTVLMQSPTKIRKNKSKLKAKTKQTDNLSLLDQNCLESSEIANDGVDLKPLLKDYYNMVYTCMIKLCGYEFEKNSDLVLHLKEMHQIELINNDSITGKNGKLSYKCIFEEKACGKKLETLNRIADHICKYHLSKIEYCPTHASKLFSSSLLIKNSDEEEEEQKQKLISKLNKNPICFNNILICSYNQCLWSFQFEEALKLHKLKHKCGMDFNDQIDLDTLKQKTKQPDRNYICTTCNARFIRPSHLKIHMRSHEKADFKCDYCSESFVKLNILLSHINEKHKQNEKIFRCHYEGCTKSYFCKMYLTSHITKSHLKQENESEKICTECNMKFKQVWLKRQHDEIKHKKYTSQNIKTFKCTFEQCTKEFMTSSKLQRHNLTHLKDKSYKCEHENCNAYFKRQYQLNSHLKMHSSDTYYLSKGIYYKCDETNCRSKFKSQERLDIHKQNHLISLVKNENEELSDDLNDDCLAILPETFTDCVEDSNENKIYSDLTKNNDNEKNNSVLISNANTSTPIFGLNNNNNFSNLKKLEYKCIYCQFKFDSNENLNFHLKSHIDINKANQKLNEYLMEISRQKENIKYQVDNENNEMKLISENVNEENNYSYLNILPHSDVEEKLLKHDECFAENQHFEKNTQQLFKIEIDNSLALNYSNNNTSNSKLIDYLNEIPDLTESITDLKHEHVININSDDEEYVTCSVVLENLSGSARTDYKSNHIYIEKYRSKRKNNERRFFNTKKAKVCETDETCESISKPKSPLSPFFTSSPSPPANDATNTTNQLSNAIQQEDVSKLTLNENLKRKLKLKSVK